MILPPPSSSKQQDALFGDAIKTSRLPASDFLPQKNREGEKEEDVVREQGKDRNLDTSRFVASALAFFSLCSLEMDNSYF